MLAIVGIISCPNPDSLTPKTCFVHGGTIEQAEVLRCDSLPAVTLLRIVSHWLVPEKAHRMGEKQEGVGRGAGKGVGEVKSAAAYTKTLSQCVVGLLMLMSRVCSQFRLGDLCSWKWNGGALKLITTEFAGPHSNLA